MAPPRRIDVTCELVGAHDQRIEEILAVEDGFAVASRDGAVALWSSDRTRTLVASFDDERALCLAREGRDLVVGTDVALHRVALVGGAPRTLLDAAAKDQVVVAVDANAGRLAVALHDERRGSEHPILLLDGDGTPRWTAECEHWPYAIRFAPDGRSIAVPSWDGYLRRYAADDGELLPEYDDHVGGPLHDATWLSPERLAVVSLTGDLTLWDPHDHRAIWRRETTSGLHAVASSPDHGWLVAGGNADHLVVHDLDGDGDAGIAKLDAIGPGSAPPRATAFPTCAPFYEVSGDRAVTALAFHASRPELLVGFHDGALAIVRITARR